MTETRPTAAALRAAEKIAPASWHLQDVLARAIDRETLLPEVIICLKFCLNRLVFLEHEGYAPEDVCESPATTMARDLLARLEK